MKVVVGKNPKKFSIEDFTDEEMAMLYILVVEGRMRIMSDMKAYHFKDPKQVRKFLDKMYLLTHNWIGSIPLGSPLRQQLFAPRI